MSAHRAIVVGLGGLGSAALHRIAAELGPGVLGIGQFALGHHRGASQDYSPIIGRARHQPQYAELSAPAYMAWDEVEAESGQQIVTRTGGLVIEDRAARRGGATGTRNIEGYHETLIDRLPRLVTLDVALRTPEGVLGCPLHDVNRRRYTSKDVKCERTLQNKHSGTTYGHGSRPLCTSKECRRLGTNVYVHYGRRAVEDSIRHRNVVPRPTTSDRRSIHDYITSNGSRLFNRSSERHS
jgi:hypothetical protein